jgi:hypothetical protein
MTFNIKTDIKFELFLPASGDFVLGVSKLGVDKLSSSSGSWIDIAANLASLETRVGPSVQSGIYTQTQPGSIAATFQSATYDPNFNARIRTGTEIRIQAYQNGTWFYMFRGRISDLSVVYNYDGSNLVSLFAYDYLQRFVNETLNPFYSAAGASTSQNLDKLAVVVPGTIGTDFATGTVNMSGYDINTDVGSILNDIITTELGLFWYESSDNKLYFENRNFVSTALSGSALYSFSDIHSTSSTHVCYNDIRIGVSTDQLANKIIATMADGSNQRYSVNRDSYELYGPQYLNISLPVFAPSELYDWCLAAVNRPVQDTVQEIIYKAINRTGDLYSATRVKVGDVVQVVKTIGSNIIDEKFVVINVSHSINTDVWQTTLELWKGL